ncbi:IclR family transcriptional regulator [Novosphingobium colocasiae]|uniref:Transcriptional regulator n=1 Tax=Novosphingobium colocasiae TaxID=1256513 RepID=A0A918PNG8_9SPHN|nr:IclR family transcriptional regulator C-terminal domain-containing protein [Novosphingobium colocasiae]GGZ16847.1 transcriptional regulator [Novosphingobium colocasiae]
MTIRNIKSAERTLALFELFSAQQKPLTVGEISKLLKIPQPSVTMLIRNLMALGYIEQDRFARTYTPTIRIALLGSWIHQAYVQDRQLEWRLSTLFNAVGESTFIGIQNGVHAQYVLFLKPEMPNRFDVQARMARPLAASAVGQALLSLKPEQEIRGLVHRANDEVSDPRFRVNPQDFMTTIEQVRARGFAETRGEVQDNIAVIAMPIRTVLGQSPIAVAVGGVIENIDAKRDLILQEMRNFVSAVSAEKTEAEQVGPERSEAGAQLAFATKT